MNNIIILSDLDITLKSGAAYSRMLEYARGLSSIKNTRVYISSLLIENDFNKLKDNAQNIFISGNKSIKRQNFFLNRYLCFLRKRNELKKICMQFKDDNLRTVFIVYNFFSTFWEEIIFLYILKKNGFRVFTERNERSLGITLHTIFPSGLLKKCIFIPLKFFEMVNSIIRDEAVRFYDGAIVISTAFEKWLDLRNKNYIRIPILADTDLMHVSINLTGNVNTFRIGYLGAISFNRDCIDVLIDAINILVKELSQEMILTIAGYGAKPTIKLINEKIDVLDLSSNVKFIGYLNGENYFNVLKDQDLFVVLRRNNLQCKYGFSSKIAEYMALGKLVLTTPVSDNSLYIKDKFNGFIINNIKAEFIAQKIMSIMNTPVNQLSNIKDEARNAAHNYFNINNYSNDLFNFIFNKN